MIGRESKLSGPLTEMRILTFLSSRCSAAFLEMYLNDNPTLLDELYDSKKYYIGSVRVDLAARLHQFGLLPNQHGKTLVEKASQQLLDGDDSSALSNKNIQRLLSKEELGELLTRVENELVPDLEWIREGYESSYSIGDDPESHFQSLYELFAALQDHFSENQEIMRNIERQESELAYWIDDNCQTPESDDDRREFDRVDISSDPQLDRSIFDDIDED